MIRRVALEESPAVRLDQAVQCGDKIGIRRTETKPARTERDAWCGFGTVRRRLLIQFALAFQNSDFLVKGLNLFLVSTGGGLLLLLMLIFEALDFLVELLDFPFQGFDLRSFRGIGRRVVRRKCAKANCAPIIVPINHRFNFIFIFRFTLASVCPVSGSFIFCFWPPAFRRASNFMRSIQTHTFGFLNLRHLRIMHDNLHHAVAQ